MSGPCLPTTSSLFGSRRRALALLAVALTATLPYLSTLNGYFLADDFGLYQLFSQKPWWHALTLFTAPWWEEIYGFRGDELRPTVAFSYQVDWWISGTRPWAGHAFNILFHVLCAFLVYAMARAVARLGVWPSAFAAALFGVMAVHAEPVAWISGRADSIPTLFYLAAVVAYARWRDESTPPWYWLSLLSFFGALFSKQSAITMLPALVLYDLLVLRPPMWRRRPRLRVLRPYFPFAAMTVAYLALRLQLFGNAVREQAITWERIELFWDRQDLYLQAMAAGVERLDGGPFSTGLAVLTLLLVGVGLLAGRRWLFLAPAWWLVTVGPMAVTYFSMRHLYLASAGIAIAAALGCQALWGRSRHAALALAAAVILGQAGSLWVHVERWNEAARLSEVMTRDMEREALSLPPGSLIVLGAPPGGGDPRRWTWVWGHSVPFTVQPPFLPSEVAQRVSLICRAEVYCCGYGNWYASTHDAVSRWAALPDRPPAVALAWELPSHGLVRRSIEPAEVLRLGDAATPGDMWTAVDAILRPMGGTGDQFRLN